MGATQRGTPISEMRIQIFSISLTWLGLNMRHFIRFFRAVVAQGQDKLWAPLPLLHQVQGRDLLRNLAQSHGAIAKVIIVQWRDRRPKVIVKWRDKHSKVIVK